MCDTRLNEHKKSDEQPEDDEQDDDDDGEEEEQSRRGKSENLIFTVWKYTLYTQQ